MPHRSLRLLTALLAAVLVPGLALAAGAEPAPVQVVDGYTVTLSLPPDRVQTGPNDVIVMIRAVDGSVVADASVSVAVIAYGAEGGHAESHGEEPADNQATASRDDHQASGPPATGSHEASADSHGVDHAATAADSHEGTSAGSHGNDHAADGQGLHAIPTMLEAGAAPGAYAGVLHFEQAGAATVAVAFIVAGLERGALFAVPVVQARPRALVLGGFALVNGAAILAAAVLKRRMPQKGRARPARPNSIPLTAAPAVAEEDRPA